MWIFPTKKEVKKEFNKVSDSFKKRDKRLNKQDSKFNNLKSQMDSNKLKIARLEGIIAVLLSKSQSQKSQSQPVSTSLKPNIETKVINTIRRNKKSLVRAEISKLDPSLSVMEMYEKIVNEQGLCSKASFYRYISSLKSQSHKISETKLRLR